MLFLIPWLRNSSPWYQAGLGEAECEYDYIVVGVPAHLYRGRLQVLSSLCAYLSAPRSLGANFNKDTLSTFPLRLPPLFLTFPDARGHVRDIWKELPQSRFRVGIQDRAHVIQ